ncbi:MAG TPA: hypothetical protein VE075_04625, partial [Thermoanaerobaculia bacterium]|nr:hypothetical protein [Thermoanaerobaculia bacterium]
MAIPPDVFCYIKLPDKLQNGAYDQFGNKVAPGAPARLVLNELPNPVAPPWQCWGVFDQPLAAGQYGFLIFTNVPGEATPGAAFTEWNATANTPDFAEDRLLVLYSVQRARGAARIIGRNDSTKPVRAAAGLLFVPPHAAPAQQAPASAGAPGAPAPPAAPAAPAAPKAASAARGA